MKQYADREYLHTRIYAMKGRLYGLREYAAVLREREPSRDGERRDEGDRAAEKEILFTDVMNDVFRLVEASDYHRPLFLAFLRQYEIKNLKLLLAKAFKKQVIEQWYPLGSYALLDRELLDENLSPGGLKERLEETYLAPVFQSGNTFDRFMIRADATGIREILHSADSLNSNDRELFLELVHMRAAVLLASWRRRLADSYGWSRERIEDWLEAFRDILEGDLPSLSLKMEEELERETGDPGARAGVSPDAEDLEYRLEMLWYRWIRHFFYRDFHSVCPVAAYLWLLSRQVLNLFGIVDGLRFQLPHDVILGRIVTDS
ncbi:MAG TPA: hypothetical protein ENN35_03840 [Deltaproteobacteria bacterium]|nr:hypothetical protein [Deltaproteobacteria bacterium]